MWENLLASWRQSGQKKDPCPSLLNHNAKHKRLLLPCCDFANGVRSVSGTLWRPVQKLAPWPFEHDLNFGHCFWTGGQEPTLAGAPPTLPRLPLRFQGGHHRSEVVQV